MTFAARMQHKIYWGRLKTFLEWSLKTWLAMWAYIASVIYHDSFWYPFRGQARVQKVLKSDWGRLFHNWESTEADEKGYPRIGPQPAGLVRSTGKLLAMAVKILLTCIREAPERKSHHRRREPV